MYLYKYVYCNVVYIVVNAPQSERLQVATRTSVTSSGTERRAVGGGGISVSVMKSGGGGVHPSRQQRAERVAGARGHNGRGGGQRAQAGREPDARHARGRVPQQRAHHSEQQRSPHEVLRDTSWCPISGAGQPAAAAIG